MRDSISGVTNTVSLWRILLILTVSIPVPSSAKVIRLDITSREVIPTAPEHGRTGTYEILKGWIYLEVYPEDSVNSRITDLEYAERNSRGNVEFSTEFELHKPLDAARGNHRLLYCVNNRGNKMGEGYFNYQAGKNWLYSNGWSYLWCGWNCDVPESDWKLNIRVPVATHKGQTISDTVYTEIVSWGNDFVYSMPLVWGGSIAYPAVSTDNYHATLTMRPYRWDAAVEVPDETWSFARYEDGNIIPDSRHIYIRDGIRPGWLYDLIYMAENPKITGLGLAAIRDVISFFKYEQMDENDVENPLADKIEYAYAWGHSQSGRLLNHFIYQDFNGDESGRIVMDGLISHCPGAGKGLFNSRFAQTTRHGSHLEDNLFPVDFFPFTTVEQYDPINKESGDALARTRSSGFLPKIMIINSSTDYWTRGASLLHTDVEGKRDIDIDPSVRIYLIAGRAHVDGRIAIIGRALLTALDQWISHGIDPPMSQIPRIADGTLVSLDIMRDCFPTIPGCNLPESFYHPYRLDMGLRWQTEGIADFVPPRTGPRYICLVPQVDEDGNELAGIRLPEIAVPVATFTGWKLRNPSFSHTLGRNTGTVWPLPQSKAERVKTGDSRVSISERYESGDEFLARTMLHLSKLRKERFILDEDLSILLDQAIGLSKVIHDIRPLEKIILEQGIEEAKIHARQFLDADNLEWFGSNTGRLTDNLNAKGYELMKDDRMDEAFQFFTLNTVLFPDDWNAWDSLAEFYCTWGKYDLALEYYEKSIEMNPGNDNGKQMIQHILRELRP